MTRDEHLAWAKQRALEYVDAGELVNAVTSMGSDLDKHPELGCNPYLLMAGGLNAAAGDPVAVRRWVEGFPMIPTVIILDMRYADPNYVGLIPTFLDTDDPRPAAVQFQERYEYGGWRAQSGFTNGNGTPVLQYPGDPPLEPIAVMRLREEMIFVYLHGYVSIFQEDGSFEACRMD